jgi:CRP-like cAMP-binding protein
MTRKRVEERVLSENRLLAALPRGERKAVEANMERVPLAFGEVVHEPDRSLRHVYFPVGGIVSILSVLCGPASIEVGTIGKEGMVGLPVFLGVNVSYTRAVVQVRGEALRMEAKVFEAAVRESRSLQRLLHLYTYALLSQMACIIACNRFHATEKRLSRWLLRIQDQVGSGEFRLTHEFIARMVGAQRPHISTAAGGLQAAGLISYRRGEIKILDRQGLEKASCTCYHNIKNYADGCK